MYTALSLGVASVEADVWLVNETLFVSHSNVHIVLRGLMVYRLGMNQQH